MCLIAQPGRILSEKEKELLNTKLPFYIYIYKHMIVATVFAGRQYSCGFAAVGNAGTIVSIATRWELLKQFKLLKQLLLIFTQFVAPCQVLSAGCEDESVSVEFALPEDVGVLLRAVGEDLHVVVLAPDADDAYVLEGGLKEVAHDGSPVG